MGYHPCMLPISFTATSHRPTSSLTTRGISCYPISATPPHSPLTRSAECPGLRQWSTRPLKSSWAGHTTLRWTVGRLGFCYISCWPASSVCLPRFLPSKAHVVDAESRRQPRERGHRQGSNSEWLRGYERYTAVSSPRFNYKGPSFWRAYT